MLLIAAAPAWRLAVIQGPGRRYFLDQSRTNYHREVELPARKGELLDCRGRVLARSEEACSVDANPHLVEDPERLAALLAPLCRVPRDELEEKLTRRFRRVALRRDVGPSVERLLGSLVERGILRFENQPGEPRFTLFVFPRQFHPSPRDRQELATLLGRNPRELAALQGSAAECLAIAGDLSNLTAERIEKLGLGGLLVQQEPRPESRMAYLEPIDASVIVTPVTVERDGRPVTAYTLRIRDEIWEALTPLWAGVDPPDREALEAAMRCRFVYLARELSLTQGEAIQALLKREAIGSVAVRREYQRVHPQGETAAGLLGRTDVDERGISGLEAMYQQVVTGVPGYRRVTVARSGRPIEQEGEDRVEPVHGKNVELTLDTVVQGYAEEAVRAAVAKFEADWGLAIVADPRTGEVLALVDIADPQRGAEYMARPFKLAFEPGSVIKPIVVAAAVEQNIVGAGDAFYCDGSTTVGGHGLECIDTHGPETVAEAVRDSCNMVLIQIAQRMGQSRLNRAFTEFGLLGRTGIGLPSEEAAGRIFTGGGELWSPSKVATVSYGKGIQVSAVGLVRAYSAILNGGTLPTLRLERRILDRDGRVVVEREPEAGPRVLSKGTADAVLGMLRSVVADEEGTGRLAASGMYQVVGKTGTSIAYARQKERVVSFIGAAPASSPRLVCLVTVGEPRVGTRWGASTCGEAFRTIVERSLQYLGVPPQATGEGPKS